MMMKKSFVVLFFIIILVPMAVYAWNDCPYGLINDPFPGECPRYVDTNNDGICDHSQPATEGALNSSDISLSGGERRNREQKNATTQINDTNSVPEENFYLLPLFITTSILYLVTYLLFLQKIINKRIYRRIWNYILTFSFLVAGITGIILILFINYGIRTPWNVSIDFWHAEFAIVMTVASLFHVHLYWKQFKKIILLKTN